MNRFFKRTAATIAVVTAIYIVLPPSISMAATKVDLGSASSFGVLALSGVTNVPALGTVVSGSAGSDIGVSAGSAVTGFGVGTGQTSGVIQNNNGVAGAAITAAGNAYINATGQSATSILPALDGQILPPGAYTTGAGTLSGGTLTLNGAGDPNAVFIIDTTSSLTFSGTVLLTGGAQACNVFWAVFSAASLSGSSTFVGHLVAKAGITLVHGAHVNGSLIATNGPVTLDDSTIVNDNCAAVVVSPPPVQTGTISSVTPATCVTSGPTTVVLNGNFPTPISNITVNGAIISATNWVQTSQTISVTTSGPSSGPVVIQLYNGAVPLLAVQTFICTAAAVVPIIPVVVPTVPTVTTGTIHVVKVVVNGYGGTATPGDFLLSLRHWGKDVVGSPAVGLADPGRTYILAPGTYVVGEPDSAAFPNYIHSFDIAGQTTQFVVLTAGENLTLIQTNTQLPPLVAPVTPGTPAPTPPPTQTGGTLPKTGSPWFNLLALGVGAMVVSGFVMGLKKSSKI